MRETLVKTEEFKDSPVEKIPKDWEVVSLKNEINILHGYAFEGEYFADEPPGDVLLVPGNFHRDGGLYFDDNNTKYYRGLIPDGTVLEKGELLIVMTDLSPRTLILGRVVLLKLPFRVLHNQRIGKIVPKLPNTWDKRFLLLVMNSDTVRRNIISNATGTTVRHTSPDRILANVVPKPPVEEQSKIAEILDTINLAIAHTSSLIAKLKQMKAGLLHDLLTRGLDENGELRDAIGQPEQFKDSPLGRIPKDWEVFKLSEIVPHAEYGISVSLDDEDGIPVLRMNNLKDGEVDLTDLKKSASSKTANLLLQPLDVLFNRTNSIEHVGRTAIWRGQIEQASFASYLVRLLPEQSKLIPEYLNVWLNLPTTQLLIRRYATPGVHQVNINPTNLRKVLIALPQKTSEQETIVERIAAHDTRIRAEEAYRNKLKLQKQGLMHDLLTGKVRVKNA